MLGDFGAGNTLGRYELLTPIAQGGMAMVWAARIKGTRGFQKLVAVKSMLPSLGEDDQFEKMFLEEAELASRIKHPNCCEILDLGEEDGTLYLVMELIHGEPLSTLQKASASAGGMPMGVALKIVHAAALGLHAAHELRAEDGTSLELVHRDVSPQNILVTHDGHVKIVDFGIAKVAGAAAEGRTQAGQVKGKVPYMAPEQCAQRKLDRRTDIFALGIVLYHLVTGKHPFRGDSDMTTLKNICAATPVERASKLAPETPPEVDAIVSRALEKSPQRRFSTMQELAAAIDQVLAKLPPDSRSRESDIGPFMKRVLGDRAEKRKRAIKDAIRVADQRTLERGTGVVHIDQPLPSGLSDLNAISGLSGPVSSPSGALGSGDIPLHGAPHNTGVTSPTAAARHDGPTGSSDLARLQTPAAPPSSGSASAVVSDAPAPARASRKSFAVAAVAFTALVAGSVALLARTSHDEPAAQRAASATAVVVAAPPPAPTVVDAAKAAPTAAATDTVAVAAATTAPPEVASPGRTASKKGATRAKGAVATVTATASAKPTVTSATTTTAPAATAPRVLDPGF
jgi:serine/threonine-protein kinase